MGRRRKSNIVEDLIVVLSFLIGVIVKTFIKLLLLIFDFITIYSSGFKQKSGKGFFKTYFDKGNYGEFKLYKKVVRVFGKRNVFTNLYLENQKTDHTEIDVVAISKEGVYVFEMKNYSGYIYGSEQNESWTQVFHKNAKNKFYNPIRQNYAHQKAVENYLKVEKDAIKPMIVFGNYAKLQKIEVSEKHVVINIGHLKTAIKQIKKKSVALLSNDQLVSFAELLILKSNMPEEVKKKHIEQVKEIQNN